jgi:hypothetical protein
MGIAQTNVPRKVHMQQPSGTALAQHRVRCGTMIRATRHLADAQVRWMVVGAPAADSMAHMCIHMTHTADQAKLRTAGLSLIVQILRKAHLYMGRMCM